MYGPVVSGRTRGPQDASMGVHVHMAPTFRRPLTNYLYRVRVTHLSISFYLRVYVRVYVRVNMLRVATRRHGRLSGSTVPSRREKDRMLVENAAQGSLFSVYSRPGMTLGKLEVTGQLTGKDRQIDRHGEGE